MNLLDPISDLSVVKRVLDLSSVRFDSFPSLKDLAELIREVRGEHKFALYQKDPLWVSTKVPGMPAILEALCEHFSRGTIDREYVKNMIEFSGFNLDQLWAIYEAWYDNKLHPLVANYKSDPARLVAYLAAKVASTKPAIEPESAIPDQSSQYSELLPDQRELF